MRLDFFLEEQSAEAALKNLVNSILPNREFKMYFHAFRGKQDLLEKLPGRLKAYSRWMEEDHKILVLVDRDKDNCHLLKARLEQFACEANLKTISGSPCQFAVINRIAIEELEAWFFGDVEAVHSAYPRIPKSLNKKAPVRNPDAIQGGTSERLEKLLMDAKYHPGGLEKIRAASEISIHMNPERNISRSFQVFRDGLLRVSGLHPAVDSGVCAKAGS